jgi:hypothetical protein
MIFDDSGVERRYLRTELPGVLDQSLKCVQNALLNWDDASATLLIDRRYLAAH